MDDAALSFGNSFGDGNSLVLIIGASAGGAVVGGSVVAITVCIWCRCIRSRRKRAQATDKAAKTKDEAAAAAAGSYLGDHTDESHDTTRNTDESHDTTRDDAEEDEGESTTPMMPGQMKRRLSHKDLINEEHVSQAEVRNVASSVEKVNVLNESRGYAEKSVPVRTRRGSACTAPSEVLSPLERVQSEKRRASLHCGTLPPHSEGSRTARAEHFSTSDGETSELGLPSLDFRASLGAWYGPTRTDSESISRARETTFLPRAQALPMPRQGALAGLPSTMDLMKAKVDQRPSDLQPMGTATARSSGDHPMILSSQPSNGRTMVSLPGDRGDRGSQQSSLVGETVAPALRRPSVNLFYEEDFVNSSAAPEPEPDLDSKPEPDLDSVVATALVHPSVAQWHGEDVDSWNGGAADDDEDSPRVFFPLPLPTTSVNSSFANTHAAAQSEADGTTSSLLSGAPSPAPACVDATAAAPLPSTRTPKKPVVPALRIGSTCGVEDAESPSPHLPVTGRSSSAEGGVTSRDLLTRGLAAERAAQRAIEKRAQAERLAQMVHEASMSRSSVAASSSSGSKLVERRGSLSLSLSLDANAPVSGSSTHRGLVERRGSLSLSLDANAPVSGSSTHRGLISHHDLRGAATHQPLGKGGEQMISLPMALQSAAERTTTECHASHALSPAMGAVTCLASEQSGAQTDSSARPPTAKSRQESSFDEQNRLRIRAATGTPSMEAANQSQRVGECGKSKHEFYV